MNLAHGIVTGWPRPRSGLGERRRAARVEPRPARTIGKGRMRASILETKLSTILTPTRASPLDRTILLVISSKYDSED